MSALMPVTLDKDGGQNLNLKPQTKNHLNFVPKFPKMNVRDQSRAGKPGCLATAASDSGPKATRRNSIKRGGVSSKGKEQRQEVTSRTGSKRQVSFKLKQEASTGTNQDKTSTETSAVGQLTPIDCPPRYDHTSVMSNIAAPDSRPELQISAT